MSGKLFLVATPIGNLGDISSRVREVLSNADLILAEDTRVSLKLLNHLGLKKRLVSCHAHNERNMERLVEQAGEENLSIALVSDAGTPLISDPGQRLVEKAVNEGVEVIPIPGASAFLLALVGSGLPAGRFVFEGFLPDDKKEMTERLHCLKNEERTIIFYIAPHKLDRTLRKIWLELGERKACLARELTKMHETFVRLPLSELIDKVEKEKPKGECVLVLEGGKRQSDRMSEAEMRDELFRFIEERLDSGDKATVISAEAARLFKLKRSDVYKIVVDYLSGRRGDSEQCDN